MVAAIDNYGPYETPPPGPCRNTAVITPSDVTPLTNVTRAIYVGGTGNITLIDDAGNTTLFSAIPVGTILPVAASQVKATGTTATLMVAMW